MARFDSTQIASYAQLAARLPSAAAEPDPDPDPDQAGDRAAEERGTRDPALPHYLGMDLETTGLVPGPDRILEVAAVIVDGRYRIMDRFSRRVAAAPRVLAGMCDYVRAMHVGTGLVREDHRGLVVVGGEDSTDVEDCLVSFVLHHFPEGDGYRPPLLGHSVHFDRGFMAYWWPMVLSLISHRNADARSVQLLAPDYPWPQAPKGKKHTALADAELSVAVMAEGARLVARARGAA